MKMNWKNRATAGVLALGLCLGLAGCGASASTSASTAESAAESTAESTAQEDVSTGESAAEDAYAYLADFSLDSLYDENGYVKDLVASDYVTLPDGFDAMVLPAELAEVSDEDVESYISANILSNYQSTEAVTDRAAADGDSVNIDFVGSIDGVEFDGGNSGGAGYDLVLGSGSFIDDFEDQIVGHMPGDTFDVNVTFPENYGSADLAGKDALFVTTLNHINEITTPELTDEFVADNLSQGTNFTNAADIRSFVVDSLLFDQGANEVYDQLVQGSVFAEEYPQALLDYYRDAFLYTPYQYSLMYGISLDDMLAQSGYTDTETFLTSAQSSIEAAIRQQLLVQAVAERKGLVCDDAALEENFTRFYGSTDLDTYNENYGANYVRMTVLQDMCMQSLIDAATFE